MSCAETTHAAIDVVADVATEISGHAEPTHAVIDFVADRHGQTAEVATEVSGHAEPAVIEFVADRHGVTVPTDARMTINMEVATEASADCPEAAVLAAAVATHDEVWANPQGMVEGPTVAAS